ncbi:hypothetical protein GCM10028773_30180 [Spirosoma koreense]
MPDVYFLPVSEADKPVVFQHRTFTFLNQSVRFPGQIDWNYAAHGKLWTYHLNYFDVLNQPDFPVDAGVALLHEFMACTAQLRDGLEPYPASLRIGNWIRFLSRYQLRDDRIDSHLFAQVNLLSHRLEYHLGGNHLLENAVALLAGALYFRHDRWFRLAAKLLREELSRQILPDGSHNERSPMYHQLLLDRLLDLRPALQQASWLPDPSLVPLLTHKIGLMLGWLTSITFRNGTVPLVNDAASGIAPTTSQLLRKAGLQKLTPFFVSKDAAKTRNTSGYRLFRRSRYELFVDVGAVGPDHQPGHAHADTFSFVLHVDNQPILVDSGTSTYQPGPRRSEERSTAAHNTVAVAATDSSEVWASFRVGRRARVQIVEDTEVRLTARHDGYRPLGIWHERSWNLSLTKLTMTDRLLSTRQETTHSGVARLHVYPGIPILPTSDDVQIGPLRLTFSSATKPHLSVTSYAMAEGFNRLRSAQCLEIAFTDTLTTILDLPDEPPVPDLLFRA